MKRYAMFCTIAGVEMLTFETDERGAALAQAYAHDADKCFSYLYDRHTQEMIEL
jgi:hypothetical protein